MRRQHYLPIILLGKSTLLREGLARILRSAKFRILASLSSADDVPPEKSSPALFLIVHSGDTIDPVLKQIGHLRNRAADGRIAIVSDHCRLEELTSAFRAGANGYFVNAVTCDRFIKSVELVMMGETIFPPAFLSFVLDSNGAQLLDADAKHSTDEPILLATEAPTAPLLSPREKAILRYIIEGDSNKSIARKIDITEATVKVHVKAILRKIRVQNRTQAAIWGINHGSQTEPQDGIVPGSVSEADKLVPPADEIIETTQLAGPELYQIRMTRIKPTIRQSQSVGATARLTK
jgi:two-component system nitrate/nitrite response regulator NarL